MRSYDVFLIDADGTLFDFELAEATAFRSVFEGYGFRYSEEVLKLYSSINDKLWKSFEVGGISIEGIKTQRFIRLFDEIGIECDACDFNEKYVVELGKCAFLIDGARDVCEKLSVSGKSVYIVTNGITQVQRARLSSSLIKDYVSDCFISELIGFQKPDVRFFEYVLKNIPKTGKDRILMVGDSLTADITGGNNAGIDTCWFNEKKAENLTQVKPTYEINRLSELVSRGRVCLLSRGRGFDNKLVVKPPSP